MLAAIWGGLLSCSLAWAAAPSPAFEKTFGYRQVDRGLTAVATADGCLVAGESLSYYMHGAGEYDAYLAKLDANGLVKWQKTYGGAKDDRILALCPTNDGGCILTGVTQSNPWRTDQDVYLLKTDAAGQMQWSCNLGGPGEQAGRCVRPTADGGYIIAGETTAAGSDNQDAFLIKTDAAGKLQWEQTFGGPRADAAACVRPTADGGYLLAGTTCSLGTGNYDIYLIKTDPTGRKLWEKTCGSGGGVSRLETTEDGGFILAGQICPDGIPAACLIKLDSQGQVQWEKSYHGNGWAVGRHVQATRRGYLLAGWTLAGDKQGCHLYLVETDKEGGKLGEKTVPGSKFDERFAVCSTPDGGCLVVGWWADLLTWLGNNNNDVQVYLAKINVPQ
ncbi:PQQ-binding-like beta-propeller repeat protein [Desulforamulus hydrothermalis]|uniref:PQQ-binding-like beta-propeller repeat protein n=1 Tax=Desulforamulus hydrothermalis TaxID=412895 RepID=UPI001160A7BD|nr:PQQ-binding-like beta-propeller repeat protein [Desulforamulus hydrothermalis]